MTSLLLTPRFSKLFRCAAAFAVLWAATTPAEAFVPAVEVHELRCDNGFPCPAEIRRRVDFWIEVFRTWNTDQVVLHDPRHPERVFSLVHAPEGCSRRGGSPAVERERERVRGTLLRMAEKLDSGAGDFDEEELALLELFPLPDSADIRRAAAELRCQNGNRDRFAGALRRFGLYRTSITRTLREYGLSEDLQFLPFVESAYDPRALSRVGAAGLWQIMPATARKLGLKLNAAVDERYDPQRSTQAAARYLSDSSARLREAARAIRPDIGMEQLNPFIITSYNYGIAATARALTEVGADYVAMLRDYEASGFGNAVKNFYASFLAARHVARHAERYFDGVAESRPRRTITVPVTSATSVADLGRLFGVGLDDLRELNPALTNSVWRGVRKIPAGFRLRLPAGLSGLGGQVAAIESKAELPVRLPKPADLRPQGAAAARTAASAAATGPKGAGSASGPWAFLSRIVQEMERGVRLRAQGGVYTLRVQPEETLGHYADWLGSGSAQEIRKRNKLRDTGNLVLGTRLVIPVSGAEQQRGFEKKRMEYHRTLLEQWLERYELIGLESYQVKTRNLTWRAVAREVGVPVWLLWRLNPGITRLTVGRTLEVPVLRARAGKSLSGH